MEKNLTNTIKVKCYIDLPFRTEKQQTACYDFMAGKNVEKLEKYEGMDVSFDSIAPSAFYVTGIFYGTSEEVAAFRKEVTELLPVWRNL